MSILKKIFQSKQSQREQVPRAPRVRVTPLHQIRFQQLNESSHLELQLSNISTSGMGLIDPQVSQIEVGTRLKGELEIRDQKIATECEVRHRNSSVLGCKFVGDFFSLSKAIEQYFKIEICSLRLNRISEAYLQKDPAGQVVWFTDGNQNEIYYVWNQNGIVKFHLSFLGNYIEGAANSPLRWGYVVDDTKLGVHKRSSLLQLKEEASDEVLEYGKLLIGNVKELPNDHSQLLSALLQKK